MNRSRAPDRRSYFGKRLRRFIRHIPRLSHEQTLARIFAHEQTLERLSALEWTPDIIYDIGAHHGIWTRSAKRVFPQGNYFLFDANAENASQLETSNSASFLVALGSSDQEERQFFLPPPGVITTGASLFREQTAHYRSGNARVRRVAVRRLDRFCKEHALPPPDLMKLDVQGAELDVLMGAGALLENCEALIAELSLLRMNEGAPIAAEIIAELHELGFYCTDLCEVHRSVSTGTSLQMDILFTRTALYERFRAQENLH
jgi:FkbM family methyltransferase